VSDCDLLGFLERSSPPLRDLTLILLTRYYEGTTNLLRCLRLFPNVTRLAIEIPPSELLADLFAALAGASSLLPNLTSLTITWTSISESAWKEVLHVVSAHRFDFHVHHPRQYPGDSVFAVLRELVAGAHYSPV
jgi:hypothetical protein